ncbi:DUF1853 family protein [Vreelandella aquamarina]
MPTPPHAEGVSAALYTLPERPASALLRDMAWLAHAPDLVELAPPIPCAGRPTLVELGLAEPVLEQWLLTLSKASLAGAQDPRATRLGHYHERLWHIMLGNAPGTRLLARNVRIAHRRNTLGELDMLYRTRANPAPVHLEVAIKFYLGLPEGPGKAHSQSRWIGPGGLDSLALKASHLHRHQLPLSTTPLALAALAHWLTPRDTQGPLDRPLMLSQRLAMPGVLFYPWHAPLPPPEGATAAHRRGRWCFLRDWPALAQSQASPFTLAWLQKPHWLAPPGLQDFHSPRLVMPAIQQQIEKRGPQQVMLYLPEQQHFERVFIVPDDWPRQVPLPPAQKG